MVKTKEGRGTHRAHRFASLSILLPHYRLIASLRFHPRNGGVALLVVGVTIPLLAVLLSLRGQRSPSGRRVGR